MRPPTPARPSRNGKMSTGWPRPIGPSPITGGEKGTDTVCQSDSACDVLVNKPVRQTIQFSSPADKPRAGDHGSRRYRQALSRGVRRRARGEYGEGEIRAAQAAREHWDERACGPRQDDADLGPHEGGGGEGDGEVYQLRRGGQGLRVPGAARSDEDPDDCDQPRGV